MADSRKIEIVYRPLAEIRPYAQNSRTHTPKQIVKLKKSLAKFGWTSPMLIADGELLAGHARLDAAIEMAAEGMPVRDNPDPLQGPTVDLSHLSKAERRAYVLADNRLALDAGWDEELLTQELQELQDDGFDISLTGFEDLELSEFFDGIAPDGDGGGGDSEKASGVLAATFGVPPFSVLNAREGWWQERKQAWISLGIQSEEGRGANLLQFSDLCNEQGPGGAELRRGREAGGGTLGAIPPNQASILSRTGKYAAQS